MAGKLLNCDSIGALDGGAVRLMVDKALRNIFADLDDRGEDGQPRKLTLELELKRRSNGEIETKTKCKISGPPMQGFGTTCASEYKDGELVLKFQELSPGNPHQRTIDEALDDENRPHEPGE